MKARSLLALLLALLLMFTLVACGSDGDSDANTSETTEESDTDGGSSADADAEDADSVAGTYEGEFGAVLDLEDEGTLDAMIPITIVIGEDGSITGSWAHETTVPDEDITDASTTAEFSGEFEDDRIKAAGRATLELSGPMGSLTDSFGVIVTGEVIGDTIVGDIAGYGEAEGFVATRQ